MASLPALAITNTSNIYTDNLLPEAYTFDTFGIGISTSGSGTAQLVGTTPFAGDRCVKLTNTAVTTTDLIASLAGTSGNVTVPTTGRYIFTWWVKNPLYNVSANNGEVRLYVDNLIVNSYYFETADVFDTWIGYYFDIILQAGDVVNLQFVFADKPASTVPNEYIFYDGFGMYFTDRDMPFPPKYEFPINYKANGSVINNSTASINLLATTDNLVQIAPDSDQYNNGNLPLLDLQGKVTPIQTGDTLAIDYRFTTIAPTNNGVIVFAKFKVGTYVQAMDRFVLSDTDGAEETWRMSFSITVTDSAFGDIFDFLGDGGLLYINPSVALTIKNCRVEVARTVRGL